MVDIAKALARPASYITKYFGCELGAQSKFDEKTGVSLVNGAHETAKLAGLLENFIKKYVQCKECKNPETEIIITKAQMLQLKCAACGFVSDVDMSDKLTTFILKNPPEQKKGSRDKKAMRRAEKERLKEGEVADEALKKLKKKGAGNTCKDGVKAGVANKKKAVSDEDNNSPDGSQGDENEVADDDDDVEWQTDTSKEAARQRIQEQLSAVTAEMVMLSPTEPEKEKPKSSMKAVTIMKNGTEESEQKVEAKPCDENGNENPKGSIHEKVVEEIQGNLRKGCTVSRMQSFLASLKGSPEEVMNALFEALFQGVAKGFSKEVSRKKNYLAAAVQNDGAQMLLLRAIDDFCRKSKPDVVKDVAMVLKTLYDADVLEEEYIVKWYEEGLGSANRKSQIWKNTKPLIE
ncbi:hypothetical protein AQUCO_05200006v1 [Aquilegia coerulea]|uniref:W2 domain-containing protein n=1 Tax=Aquilegia coerulea TaxID=218851 RepID=A0A2G5CIH9_AQUCA|nr:hypothetical protein AQUCO_05200006v1 [Aquilegia coerulea]